MPRLRNPIQGWRNCPLTPRPPQVAVVEENDEHVEDSEEEGDDISPGPGTEPGNSIPVQQVTKREEKEVNRVVKASNQSGEFQPAYNITSKY